MKKWEQVISEVWTEHQRLINSSQSPRPPFRINSLGHSVENLQPIRYLQIKFSRRKTRSQQRVSVTAPQTSRFLDCFSCEIGPFIHVVQNRHTEEQKVALGQDKQRKLPFKIMYAFYLSCPSATLLSSMAVLYDVNGQLQGPISQEKQSRSLGRRDTDTLQIVIDRATPNSRALFCPSITQRFLCCHVQLLSRKERYVITQLTLRKRLFVPLADLKTVEKGKDSK